MDYLTSTLDYSPSTYPSASVILAGDLNQLPETDLGCLRTGLRSVVKLPTRGPSFLDRGMYRMTQSLMLKSLSRATKSDHSAIIAYEAVINVSKPENCCL